MNVNKMVRAVIYARCSTEEESQKDALVKQVKEAKECVEKMGWTLVDTYVESRSGTSAKTRPEYTKLYDQLSSDRFDVIVIKSQDRLMRNTKDWYLFVDRLSSCHKRLYIYLERKFYTPDDALITGIKAILAEEYSRELSKKINNAHHNRQKNGGNIILPPNTYGYRKLPDKTVEIIEEEAEIKRRMYELCAAGYGSRTIASILQNDGITNRQGKPFTDSNIRNMIRNPLNKGVVVMNRRHYDFDSKKTLYIPKEQQYIYEGKVPAIVSKELWEQANNEIASRNRINRKKKKKRDYKGKFILSGKLVCGLCGAPYYRTFRKRYRNGEAIYEWKCRQYIEIGRDIGSNDRPKMRKVPLERIHGCSNVHLNEEKLLKLLRQTCDKDYQLDKDKIIRKMVTIISKALEKENPYQEIEKERAVAEKIRQKLNVLVEKVLDGIISDQVYQAKQSELLKKLEESEKKVQTLEMQYAQGNLIRDRIEKIKYDLETGDGIAKASLAEMLQEIEVIKVFPEHLEVKLNLSQTLKLDGIPLSQEAAANDNTIQIEFGNLFNYQKKKKEERNQILKLMEENPEITARQIAEKCGVGLSGANYRISILKKEGKIRFHGKGGKGSWEVIQSNSKETN